MTERRVLARRLVFLALVTMSTAALLVLAALTLSPGGFDGVDLLLLVLFALTTPWMVVGFWNAAIGFLIMRLARDPVRQESPPAILASTALVMCVRNEPPDRVIRGAMPGMDPGSCPYDQYAALHDGPRALHA